MVKKSFIDKIKDRVRHLVLGKEGIVGKDEDYPSYFEEVLVANFKLKALMQLGFIVEKDYNTISIVGFNKDTFAEEIISKFEVQMKTYFRSLNVEKEVKKFFNDKKAQKAIMLTSKAKAEGVVNKEIDDYIKKESRALVEKITSEIFEEIRK